MRKASLDARVLADPSWLHWMATLPLLAGRLSGVPYCLEAAIGLCGAAAMFFLVKTRSVRAMPVQVRLGYLGLLLLGALPYGAAIHWIQLLGTSAMVVGGYCPLLRMLRLLPWNRKEPLSCGLVWRVFALDPSQGGAVRWEAAASAPPAALESCSLLQG